MKILKLDHYPTDEEARASIKRMMAKHRASFEMLAARDAGCPACGSSDLAKIKGCIVCLACRRKQDCNGW